MGGEMNKQQENNYRRFVRSAFITKPEEKQTERFVFWIMLFVGICFAAAALIKK